ncbi:MAG: hypothetical protein GEU95_14640 [Rhizobiales bacterium]|nr:hypothetical protein [Hyphomicrobiales bacterium]
MKHLMTIAVLITVASTSHSVGQTHQPYAGLQSRSIKALSDGQLADLRSGRGMGLAIAAELNGYPGPLHVIEHADALGLSQEQRVRMQRLFETMRDEAIALGDRLIEQEAALDHLFATRTITAPTLARATAAIGQTQAELRAAHLRYHLLTSDVLNRDQMDRYAELRGYRGGERRPSHQPQHRH